MNYTTINFILLLIIGCEIVSLILLSGGVI